MTDTITSPQDATEVDQADVPELEVRRNAGLNLLMGVAGCGLAIAYLYRASVSGSATDWVIAAVMSLIGLLGLKALFDSRTPLLIADTQGVRIRLGKEWRGLPWAVLSQVVVEERTSLLRDGRLVLAPRNLDSALAGLDSSGRRQVAQLQKWYGAPLCVPLAVTTRATGADLVEQLEMLSGGSTDVVLLRGKERAVLDDVDQSHGEGHHGTPVEPVPLWAPEPTPEDHADANDEDSVYDQEADDDQRSWLGDFRTELDGGWADEGWAHAESEDQDNDWSASGHEEQRLGGDALEPASSETGEPLGAEVSETTEDQAAQDHGSPEHATGEPETGPGRRAGATAGWLVAAGSALSRAFQGRRRDVDNEERAEDAEAAVADGPPTHDVEFGDTTSPEDPAPTFDHGGSQEALAEDGPGSSDAQPAAAHDPAGPAADVEDVPDADAPDALAARSYTPVEPMRATRRALRAELTTEPYVSTTGRAAHPPTPKQGWSEPRAEEPRPGVRQIVRVQDPVEPLVIDDFVTEPALEPVIGPEISAARNRAGLSIDQLSDRTRIRPHVLESIEVDDFGPCGGDFYARGHLRTLSRFLGLDAEQLLAAYDAHYAHAPINARRVFEAELATGMGGGIRATLGGPRWSLLVGAVLCLMLIWGVAKLFTEPTQQLVTPDPGITQSGRLSAAKGPAAPSDITRLTLSVRGEKSKVRVTVVDRTGHVVWQGRLAPGAQKVISGRAPYTVRSDNAGAVRLRIGARELGVLGAPGKPGTRTVA